MKWVLIYLLVSVAGSFLMGRFLAFNDFFNDEPEE